ncbi:TPA: hypothetical protein ACGXNJ_005176 [Bacillus cereus]
MKLEILNNMLHQNLTLNTGDLIIAERRNKYRHYQIIQDGESGGYKLLHLESMTVLATFNSHDPSESVKFVKEGLAMNIVSVIRSKNIKMGLI